MFSDFLNFSAEPDFVSMYEIGNYVYIFFREVAIEYINCGKVSFHTMSGECLASYHFYAGQ